MYTKNLSLYSSALQVKDTLNAENENGRFEEQALVLRNSSQEVIDVLSMCRNRTTPNKVKLVKIGNNLFQIEQRYVIKITNKTLEAFDKSFDKPRHCDHASHYSHYSSR